MEEMKDDQAATGRASATTDCSDALRAGGPGICGVPPEIATCPECGGGLYAEAEEWDAESGTPTKLGLRVSCIADDENCMKWSESTTDNRPFREVSHKCWQSDWQPVIDVVAVWCGARLD